MEPGNLGPATRTGAAGTAPTPAMAGGGAAATPGPAATAPGTMAADGWADAKGRGSTGAATGATGAIPRVAGTRSASVSSRPAIAARKAGEGSA